MKSLSKTFIKFGFMLSVLFVGIGSRASAQVVSVMGEATYYDDGTRSKLECMRLAAEEARINALAKKFGTVVAQNLVQTDRVSGNREHNDFLSLTTSEVRGEWIGDEGEPMYEISNDKEGNFVVRCRIKGKAAPISNQSTEFEALVLRNAPTKQAADNRFRDGDTMYLYFNGAADGFVTAFLQDEQNNVFQLLPYSSDTKTRVPTRKNKEYIFFSPEHRGDQFGQIDELILTAPDNVEYNRLYVVFSPEYYSQPVMSRSPGGLPVLDSKAFTSWLAKARRNDPKMGVNTMTLEIAPRH